MREFQDLLGNSIELQILQETEHGFVIGEFITPQGFEMLGFYHPVQKTPLIAFSVISLMQSLPIMEKWLAEKGGE